MFEGLFMFSCWVLEGLGKELYEVYCIVQMFCCYMFNLMEQVYFVYCDQKKFVLFVQQGCDELVEMFQCDCIQCKCLCEFGMFWGEGDVYSDVEGVQLDSDFVNEVDGGDVDVLIDCFVCVGF